MPPPPAKQSPLPVAKPPHVLIVMAVRNGARHLEAQLASLAAQDHRNWSLLVSDDGSTDESLAQVQAFAQRGFDVAMLPGPCLGLAENFMSLLRRAPYFLQKGSWLALCDQDDVWLPNRLSRGLAQLEGMATAQPAMVFHRTLVTDASLRPLGPSLPRPRPPGFRNALVQNIAAGNTILLNPPATQLACAAAHDPKGVVMHDWWLYQLITGAGGLALHDDMPVLYYRQHGGNEIGANLGVRAKLHRLAMVLAGRFAAWNRVNRAALSHSAHRFSAENRALLHLFEQLCTGSLPDRLRALWRGGFYRQSGSSTLALVFAALLGKV